MRSCLRGVLSPVAGCSSSCCLCWLAAVPSTGQHELANLVPVCCSVEHALGRWPLPWCCTDR